MGGAQRPGIEHIGLVTTERVAPQHREDGEGDDAHHGALDIDRAKLAALDAGAQHMPHQGHAAMHHLVQIKARQLRKIARFRQHQLGDCTDRRRDDFEKALYQAFEAAGRGFGCIADHRFRAGYIGQKLLPDDRLEELFLILEVEVYRPFCDPGAQCNVVEPRRGKAALGEACQRCGQDLPRTGILALSSPQHLKGLFRAHK